MKVNVKKYSLVVLPVLLFFFFACGAKVNESTEEQEVEVKSDTVENLGGASEENIVATSETPKGKKVKIVTSLGNIIVLLYDETPQHQKNFIKLVGEKFYDGVLFHRVIKDFMIQAGDPESKTATTGQPLGSGGPGYTIAAEFNPKFFHKKGALSAARLGDQANPEKRSSGSQFYIVQGKKYNDQEITMLDKQMEQQAFMMPIRQHLAQNPTDMNRLQEMQAQRDELGLTNLIDSITEIVKKQNPQIKVNKLSEEQKNAYKTVGGTPHLDGGYTVFGEVLEGLEVVDKIAAVATGAGDRPIEDVKILSMELLKK